MKVALCISGQPRNYREAFPFIYNHIIQPNSADVFFHTWFDPDNRYMEKQHLDRGNCEAPENTIQELVALYTPKDYLVEKPKEFKNPSLVISEKRIEYCKGMNKHKNMSDEECRAHMVKQHTSMYYSFFKAVELKENYANQHGIHYDFVIRLRFDVVPYMPIHLHNLDPNFLYYQDMGHPDELISDWINFGSNCIMNVASSIYMQLEYLNVFTYYTKDERLPNTLEPSDVCGGMYEHTLRDMISLHKIPTRRLQLNCNLTPRS